MHTHTSMMIKPPNITAANAAIRLVVTLLAMFTGTAAHASLGGDSASIEADRLHMNVKLAARQTASSTGSYTVNETTLPSGTLVRQYVSRAGVVFAVTWSGPFIPDLRQLLGPHFDTMVAQQAKLSNAGHRHFSLHESGLVIESGGHPRSFAGRAYLPGALPAGVTVQEIQ
ncbi:MAG: DUF2844 domain-containing protein [Gallionella sp.]